jgi:glyoxylase I family protein
MPIGTKNRVIKGCGLHHIAVQTRDLEESLRFYRDLLGMRVVTEGGPPDRRIVLLDMGDGGCIELFEPTADSPAADSPVANDLVLHIALTTTDVHSAIDRVRRAGHEVTVEPRDSGLGELKATIAFFKGPNGEVIEFWQPR